MAHDVLELCSQSIKPSARPGWGMTNTIARVKKQCCRMLPKFARSISGTNWQTLTYQPKQQASIACPTNRKDILRPDSRHEGPTFVESTRQLFKSLSAQPIPFVFRSVLAGDATSTPQHIQGTGAAQRHMTATQKETCSPRRFSS